MKEFYRFIGSRDIREHLEKINYNMSAAECTYIVYESMLPLAEKHIAYKRIIDTMEDIQLPCERGSLHKALKTRMELDNILTEVFKQEDRAVYMYSYLDREEDRDVYADWRRCLEEAFEWREDEAFVRVEKKWITVGDEKPKSMSVLFNENREIVSIAAWRILNDELQDKFWSLAATAACINIPTPFKKGDILYSMADGVFVYDSQRKRQNMQGYKADICGDVGLYTIVSPYDAKYYMGKIEKKDKNLKDISLYLKNKIDLARLIERCKE